MSIYFVKENAKGDTSFTTYSIRTDESMNVISGFQQPRN